MTATNGELQAAVYSVIKALEAIEAGDHSEARVHIQSAQIWITP